MSTSESFEAFKEERLQEIESSDAELLEEEQYDLVDVDDLSRSRDSAAPTKVEIGGFKQFGQERMNPRYSINLLTLTKSRELNSFRMFTNDETPNYQAASGAVRYDILSSDYGSPNAITGDSSGMMSQADIFAVDNLASRDLSSQNNTFEEERLMARRGTALQKAHLSNLNFSSSEDGSTDSDDDLGTNVRQIIEKSQKEKIRLGIAIKASIYESTAILKLICLNEINNARAPQTSVEQGSQLLSLGQDFYNIKRELMLHSSLQKISRLLYSESLHPYFGLISCVRMFQAKSGTVIFVGNSKGYIRAFDLQTQKERKPLFDSKLPVAEVLSFDISENGAHLVAGYSKGMLVLWDLVQYKKVYVANDVLKNETSEFTIVKHIYNDKTDGIIILTADDLSCIRLVLVTNSIIGTFGHQVFSLYESALKNVGTISVLRPSSSDAYQKSEICKGTSLTAIGGSNQVVIVQLKPFPPKEIKVLANPDPVEVNSQVYLDWGYGLTPTKNDNTRPLLAVAWDYAVQLFYIQDNQIIADGFYSIEKPSNQTTTPLHYNDQINATMRIIQVLFMADSILVLFLANGDCKIINTENFRPGSLVPKKNTGQTSVTSLRRTIIQKNTTTTETQDGDLETKKKVLDLKTHTADKNQVNFNNTICCYRKSIILIGKTKLHHARLLSWREYIDKLKFQDNLDWLTLLKVSLDIYSGEIRGFAHIPDTMERRRTYFQSYMRDLIQSTVQKAISKYKDGRPKDSESSEYKFRIEKVASQAAIEFCLKTQDTEYLFTKIYSLYSATEDLQSVFLCTLGPAIVAGQMKDVRIPAMILTRLIENYEKRREFAALERLILNIDMEQHCFGCKTTAESLRQSLVKVSTTHQMVSALMHLQASEATQQSITHILQIMFQKIEDHQRTMIFGRGREVTKQTIKIMKNADKKRKWEIEQSPFYLTYRLMWIIGQTLKGRKIPNGTLNEEQHKAYTLNIVDFITSETVLDYFLEFDPEAFFQMIVHLFCGKPSKFFKDVGDYKFKFNQTNQFGKFQLKKARAAKNLGVIDFENTVELERRDSEFKMKSNFCKGVTENNILVIFKTVTEQEDRKNPKFTWSCFLELLLNIVVQQHSEAQKDRYEALMKEDVNKQHNQEKEKPIKKFPKKTALKFKPFMFKADECQIEYNWILTAIKSVLSGKQGQQEVIENKLQKTGNLSRNEVNQQLIISTLRAVKLHQADIEEIIGLITKDQGDLIQVRIALLQNKEDYEQVFFIYLTNQDLTKNLFKWLNETFELLTEGEENQGQDNKIDQLDSDSDEDKRHQDEQQSTQVKEKSLAGPFKKLKRSVKQKVLELAKVDSAKTVKLVEKYLSQGDFQEKLITQKFGKYEDEQFSYLKNYIKNNKDKIVENINLDQDKDKSLHLKYEKYILLFTKLLCKLKKDEIEDWVNICYFPADKCLQICKEFGNLKGQAILSMRNYKPIEAISAYLELLSSMPADKFIEQIKLSFQHLPNFLPKCQQSETGGSMLPRKNFFEPELIREFDLYLSKACMICVHPDVDSEDRNKGWMLILEYLQNWVNEANNKCLEAIRMAEKLVGYSSFSILKKEELSKYVHSLTHFMKARIDYILQFPRLKIPLKQILQQLNLTLAQIQSLCSSKLKHSKTIMQIEKCQQIIFKRQFFEEFLENFKKISAGHVVEAQKRRDENTKKILGSSVCNSCIQSITDATKQYETVFIYQCGHQFHGSCLTSLQKQSSLKNCPICIRKNYLAIRDQKENEIRQAINQQKGEFQRQQNLEDLESDSENDLSGVDKTVQQDQWMYSSSLFQQEQLANRESFRQTKMNRRMNQFELILDDTNLKLSQFDEFQEMIAD